MTVEQKKRRGEKVEYIVAEPPKLLRTQQACVDRINAILDSETSTGNGDLWRRDGNVRNTTIKPWKG